MAAVMIQQVDNGWVVETVGWPMVPRRFVAGTPDEAMGHARTLLVELTIQETHVVPFPSAEQP